MRALLAFALVVTGCAEVRPRPPTLPRLPHHLERVTAAGAVPASDGDLDAALRAARVVYAGEQHDDPHIHAFQLELFERLAREKPRLALGLEMLPKSAQPVLDDYVAGKIDEATLVDETAWPRAWGFPFDYYRPLLAFARDHHLRVYALNAPRELVHKIAAEGEGALSPEEKAELPEIVPGPPEHRAALVAAMRDHPGHVGGDPETTERFYRAQLVWDETMADTIARVMKRPDAPDAMLVLAGAGHVERFAIPLRVARRGVGPELVVMPEYAGDRPDPAADFVWRLER